MVEAAKWHLIAKAGGVADESLDKIVAKLSKADRAHAQKAADDWRDSSRWGSSRRRRQTLRVCTRRTATAT